MILRHFLHQLISLFLSHYPIATWSGTYVIYGMIRWATLDFGVDHTIWYRDNIDITYLLYVIIP